MQDFPGHPLPEVGHVLLREFWEEKWEFQSGFAQLGTDSCSFSMENWGKWGKFGALGL